ncbi:MAG: hypothetical protein JNL52_08855 [Flavobacteriales bacterium]|nr:hypothetical protein [Flavobacteriales bacterium]
MAALLVAAFAGHAQISLVGNSPVSLVTIGTLNGGIHLIEFFSTNTSTGGTRSIYHPDLTLFRVLNYPAPPSGYAWSSMGYITEDLFDTDPSTVEFVMTASDLSAPGNFGVFVYREDGTELFQQIPGSMVSGIGGLRSSFEPIFTTDEGTFMVVHGSSVGGPPVNIYQLPGTLPCVDCHGTPLPSGLVTGTPPADGISPTASVSHDATTHALHVLPGGMHVDEVSVLDAAGRLVITQRVNTTERFTIDAARLTPGVHVVVLQDRGVRVASMPVVVR